MGNEISKKYEMAEQPSASGGLSCMWKIYSAKDKASGLPVSVHVFKKDDLKVLDKAIREQVLDILRRDLKTLTIVNTVGRPHPSVIRHIETFDETRAVLAFVTERVACSLANAIGDGPSGLPPQTVSAVRRTFERYEIARGFFGLVEGLQFVHTIKRRLHLNLAPESIFLAPSGQWKLGGFGFSVDLPSTGASTTPCPYFQTGAKTGFEGTWRLHPVMAFSSPEATAPAGSSDVSCASDLFSLGCLMYQLCRDDPRGARLVQTDPSPMAHQTFCSTLNYPGTVNVNPLFSEVQSLVVSLLQTNPAARPNLGNVTINPVFHGKEVTVLKTIDGIPGRNPAEAATFLTSIRTAVASFPLRVQRDCIMHPLLDACAADESGRLWGSALPIVTDMCDRLDRKEIIANVQVKFVPALKAQQLEALNSLVLAMPLYLKKMEVAFFRSDVVPMVSRALQVAGNPQVRDTLRRAVDVQEAALKAVTDEAFHTAIDGRTRELTILPRICLLVVKGTAPRVKVNALLCISKTFHFYQVRAAVDKILPTLKFAAERDQTVAIQLCVLGCYEAISKRLQRLGPVATHILPACTPILACPGLNSNQFDMVVGIVQSMTQSVIAYRKQEIANPKAYAIDTTQPTHPGGVPYEEEIQRQRNAALGTWKPAPSSPTSAAGSDFKTFTPSGLPGSSPPVTPAAAAASSQGGFEMDDIFSSLPAPTSSVGSPSPSPGVLTPTRAVQPIAAAAGTYSSSGGMGMFRDFSLSQQQVATTVAGAAGNSNGKPAGGTMNGCSDPFSSAGFGDAFNSPTLGGMSSGAANVGMSWMKDAFGGGGGGSDGLGGTGGGADGGMSSNNLSQAGGSNFSRGSSGAGGLGGSLPLQSSASPMMGGTRPSLPSVPSQSSSSVGGDAFSAFFDAAVSGGAGSGARDMFSKNTSPQAAGGYGVAPSQGYGSASMGRATGVGATLEDQLAKTQREIAQLTQELATGAGVGLAVAATAVMGQGGGGGGGGGWGMPGLSAGFNNGVGSAGSQQTWQQGGSLGAAAQSGQVQNTSDPFAFLDAASHSGNQGTRQGGSGSGFDFLGK